MKLQLHQLVSVSNNSIITNNVLRIVNEKLTPEELKEFENWLRIVKQEQQSNKRF